MFPSPQKRDDVHRTAQAHRDRPNGQWADEDLAERHGGGEIVIDDRYGQIRNSNTINRRGSFPSKG